MRMANSTAIKVQKKQVRWQWLLRLFMVALLVAGCAWSWLRIHNPNFMPVKNIKVDSGYQHIDQKTIISVVTPFVTAQGLFTINVRQLKNHLMQIPWVYQVWVKRIWPDTILVKISEQQAGAVWNKTALLNQQADIFTPDLKTFPAGLPEFNGPDGQQLQMWQYYQQFSQLLAPLQLSIKELDLNPRRSWQMQLSNNLVIMLGRDNLQQRLQRFVAVYPKIFANPVMTAKAVDLRYTDGLAIEWNNPLPKSNFKPTPNNLLPAVKKAP